MYMFRLKGLFSVMIIRLTSMVQLTVPIRTSSRCPSSSWWCRDPGPCARWVCVVLSFVLVGGLPPCGPHGFRFTPFDHFCTRNPVGYWSALHTCQPSDPIFKSYRIRFSRKTNVFSFFLSFYPSIECIERLLQCDDAHRLSFTCISRSFAVLMLKGRLVMSVPRGCGCGCGLRATSLLFNLSSVPDIA